MSFTSDPILYCFAYIALRTRKCNIIDKPGMRGKTDRACTTSPHNEFYDVPKYEPMCIKRVAGER